MDSPRRFILFFLLLMLGVSSFLYIPRYLAERAQTAELANLISNPESGKTRSLEARTKSAGCISENSLPDHACTPGAVFGDISEDRVCTPGYSKTVRNVPQKLRKEVFAEYGVPYSQPRGSYEVDHLIPLALGGDNEIANLFPQPAEPPPGFREKDIVEIFLHEEVCAGRADLASSQWQIANDWLAIYKNLTAAQIEKIKNKYRNWSN